MVFPISALLPRARALHFTGPLSRIQSPGVKFTHTRTPGSPQVLASFGAARRPATSLLLGHINAAQRAGKFSTGTATFGKSSLGNGSFLGRERRGWLGRVIFGAALGVSTAAVVHAFHTGTLTTMALNVDLNSAQGDWKKTKGETVHKGSESPVT